MIADRVAVMYLGRLVEIGSTADVFARPAHPYTRALLASVPVPDPRVRPELSALQGELPSGLNRPSGCVFRSRCPLALPACAEASPPLTPAGSGHQAACIRIDAVRAMGDTALLVASNSSY